MSKDCDRRSFMRLAGLAGVIGGSTFLTEPAMAAAVGSVIFVVVVVGGMSPFLMASLRIEGTRNAMVSALREANLSERDGVSVALVEKGQLTVQGFTFTSERLKQIGSELFDRKGALLDPGLVAEIEAKRNAVLVDMMKVFKKHKIGSGLVLAREKKARKKKA